MGTNDLVRTAHPTPTLHTWRLVALLRLLADTGVRSAVVFDPQGGRLMPAPRRMA